MCPSITRSVSILAILGLLSAGLVASVSTTVKELEVEKKESSSSPRWKTWRGIFATMPIG
jgi:hypothetical protein